MTHYTIDAIIIILILLIGYSGFRRGLLSSAALLIAKILSVVLALFFHEPFLNTLDSVFSLKQKLSPGVTSFISNNTSSEASTLLAGQGESLFVDMTDFLTTQLTSAVSSYVLKILSFLLLASLLYLCFSLLIKVIIKPLAQNRLLAPIDKGAGFIVNSLCAIFVIALFVGLTEAFWPVFPEFNAAFRNSFSFDLLMKAYAPCIQTINSFFDNTFVNPMDSLPSYSSLQI